MTPRSQQWLRYDASVDGISQAVHVTRVGTPASTGYPVVLVLHDRLDDPTLDGFREHAFRTAAYWSRSIDDSEPLLLVQPFGRGNTGWLGVGMLDLADVWQALAEEYALDACRVGLVGVGLGGEAALRLAGWYPDRFVGVAAVAPTSDDTAAMPLGRRTWPLWERPARRSVAPRELATQLVATPIRLEAPWWCQGVADTAGYAQLAALQEAIEAAGGTACELHRSEPHFAESRQLPQTPGETLAWLLRQAPPSLPAAFDFRATAPRGRGAFGVEPLVLPPNPQQPARFELTRSESGLGLRPAGVELFRLDAERFREIAAANLPLSIEGSPLPTPSQSPAVYLVERLTAGWRVEVEGEAQPSPPAPSPFVDFASLRDSAAHPLEFWHRPTLLVPGTLGDERENDAQRRYADWLARRLREGVEWPRLAGEPGITNVAVDVLADVDVRPSHLASHHLLCIGAAWNHLLLARWQTALPTRWRSPQEVDGPGFTIGTTLYDDPHDVLFLRARCPEAEGCLAWIIAANSPAGLGYACRARLAWLPTLLVQREHEVLAWATDPGNPRSGVGPVLHGGRNSPQVAARWRSRTDAA